MVRTRAAEADLDDLPAGLDIHKGLLDRPHQRALLGDIGAVIAAAPFFTPDDAQMGQSVLCAHDQLRTARLGLRQVGLSV